MSRNETKNGEVFSKVKDDPESNIDFDILPKYYADACQQMALKIPDYYDYKKDNIEYVENTYNKVK